MTESPPSGSQGEGAEDVCSERWSRRPRRFRVCFDPSHARRHWRPRSTSVVAGVSRVHACPRWSRGEGVPEFLPTAVPDGYPLSPPWPSRRQCRLRLAVSVTIHVRRFGYPPELVGLRFDGEANLRTLGDKRVLIPDTPDGRCIAWSFAPDKPIAVSASPTLGHSQNMPSSASHRSCRRVDRSSDRNSWPRPRRP